MTELCPESMSDKETKWVFYPPPPKLRELSFFIRLRLFDAVPKGLENIYQQEINAFNIKSSIHYSFQLCVIEFLHSNVFLQSKKVWYLFLKNFDVALLDLSHYGHDTVF